MSKKSRERREAAIARNPAAVKTISGERSPNTALEESSLLRTNSERMRQEGVPAKAPSQNRKQQNSRIYFWCVLGISVLLSVFILIRMNLTVNEQLSLQLTVNETDISAVADGTYSGEYTSSHMSAKVSVDIASGRMMDIRLDSFTGIDNVRAEEVFDRVLYYQMLNVPEDDIGSQPTDKIVLKAVEKALVGAMRYEAE